MIENGAQRLEETPDFKATSRRVHQVGERMNAYMFSGPQHENYISYWVSNNGIGKRIPLNENINTVTYLGQWVF